MFISDIMRIRLLSMIFSEGKTGTENCDCWTDRSRKDDDDQIADAFL